MIDVVTFIFKEFVCTEEQAASFLQTISFVALMIEFRTLLKKCSEKEIDDMAKLIASISPQISEQTSKDMFRQTCQGPDAAFAQAMQKYVVEEDFSVNNLLQYLSEDKQEQFIRNLCNHYLHHEKRLCVEPRGSRKKLHLNGN